MTRIELNQAESFCENLCHPRDPWLTRLVWVFACRVARFERGADQMSIRKYLYPPVVLVAGLLMIVLLHLLIPVGEVPGWLSRLGGVLFILGGAPGVLVIRQFRQAGTTIHPHDRSSSLVTEGLFRYSRNPIYLGMACALLGAALFLGSLLPLVVVPLFMWIIQSQFIVNEERMLEDKFGEAYRVYKTRVRRWL